MKQFTRLLFCVLVLASQASAQDTITADARERFNGRWVFDFKRSDPSNDDVIARQTLVISYHEPEIRIVITRTRKSGEEKSTTLVLYADNRGEKNLPIPFNQDLEVESKTVWIKEVLTRTFTVKLYQKGKVVGGITTRQSNSLSKDGNTLTIVEEVRAKAKTVAETDDKWKSKEVYNREK